MDDIQYNRHIEMTLRKVGFDVETVNNEFNINEPLLSFNPDYIIARGNSARLSVLNVGKKLKEASNLNNGKVVLVFPENIEPTTDDLFKIKADLILNDPISTLRLVLYIISLTGSNVEMVKEKLLKFAITDVQFRNNEQQILKFAGLTIDSEIQILSNMEEVPASADSGIIYFPDHTKAATKKDDLIVPQAQEDAQQEGDRRVTAGIGSVDVPSEVIERTERISEEIGLLANELPLRIDSYNRSIKNLDQDLKIGHKKRQTRKEVNQLHKDLIAEHKTDKQTEANLDDERMQFTKALFKK